MKIGSSISQLTCVLQKKTTSSPLTNAVLAFITVLSFTTACQGSTKEGWGGSVSTQSKAVIGYLPFWDHEQGLQTVMHNRDVFSEISPFWYTLDDSGRIVHFDNGWYDDGVVNSLLRQNDIKLTPTLTNFESGSWRGAVVSQIINDPKLMKSHIASIVEVVTSKDYDGIDIDYESLFPHDRDAFSKFIEELASALHANGKSLSVVVYAKTFDPGYGSARAYDYAALARAADQVRLMVYNKHWTTSPSGPIAPLDWVDRVTAFAVSKIPREKLILGFGLYGIDWVGERGKEIEWEAVLELVNTHGAEIYWGARSQSPRFKYTDLKGKEHVVWFENYASIEHKLSVAQRYGVAGVHFWRLGGEDSRVWQVVESEFVALHSQGYLVSKCLENGICTEIRDNTQ